MDSIGVLKPDQPARFKEPPRWRRYKMAEKRQFQAIKGTRDILPPDSSLWNWFEATARRVMETYGFREVRLPVFEERELFARSVGADTDIVNKEMYVFDLHGSFVLQYLQQNLSRYPEEFTVLEFERMVQDFVLQLNAAAEAERIQKTEKNLTAITTVRRLCSEFVKHSKQLSSSAKSEEWAGSGNLSNLAEAISRSVESISFGSYVALRPEATASVVRAYIEHGMHTLPGNVKLYYVGPMFRRERPQKGRYRQFYQIGAEVLSRPQEDEKKEILTSAAIDAELIEMLTALLGECGIKDCTLLVNSIGCANCRPKYVAALRAALEAVKAKMCGDCQRRAETNPLRVLDCKVEADQPIIAKLPAITDYLDEPCREHFREFQRQLKLRDITSFMIAPRLVRGLDYYMRTTFEITSPVLGAQNALVGGGRYDGLSELLGGPPAKGIGFALGTDRFVEAIQEAGKVDASQPIDVFIAWLGQAAYPTAVKLARRLRDAGLSVELPAEEMKLKKSLGLADKMGARYALIVGENEVASGRYGLKRLADGTQRELTEGEMLEYLKKERAM